MTRSRIALVVVCLATNSCALLDTDKYDTQRYQAVHEATLNGERTKMNQMLKSNPRLINVADYDNNTLLHLAVLRNQVGEVQDLLARHANVNAVNTAGMTPLHLAAKLNELEITRLLLEHRPTLTIRDGSGRTPLMWAIKMHHNQIAHLLKGAGAHL